MVAKVRNLTEYAEVAFRMTQTMIIRNGKEKMFTAWNVKARELADGRIKVLVTWSEDEPEEGQRGEVIMRPFFLPAGWLPPMIQCSAR
jgi:hypothetical protein